MHNLHCKICRNLVLLAKEEMVLQGITDRLTEIEDAMEGKLMYRKGNDNLKASIPNTEYDGSETTENIITRYLGSMVTNDTKVHVQLKPGLPWQKQHSTRRLVSPTNWI
jgi:archaellum component FlaF (FlaF/FlaG flagellin family)